MADVTSGERPLFELRRAVLRANNSNCGRIRGNSSGAIPTKGQPDRRHHRQPEREKQQAYCVDKNVPLLAPDLLACIVSVRINTRTPFPFSLHAIVHPADIQDRDGGALVMAALCGTLPSLKMLFIDDAYRGPRFAKAVA